MSKFHISICEKKPVNNLEKHLIEVAKAWCTRRGSMKVGSQLVQIRTLEHFQNALQRERDLYCQDTGARPTSVAIQYLEDGANSLIWIRPNDDRAAATATISLTAEGKDHQQIQDSLLIPLRT